MSDIISSVAAFIIAFPAILFFLSYLLILKGLGKKSMAAFGLSADITTFFLFFSVPAAIYAFWELNTAGYLLIAALLIGITMTVREWRTQKEVIVIPLLRKIWRSLFLVLNLFYLFAIIGGAIFSIMRYMS